MAQRDGDADELGQDVPGAALAARDDDPQDAPVPVGAADRGRIRDRQQAAEAEHELVDDRIGAREAGAPGRDTAAAHGWSAR